MIGTCATQTSSVADYSAEFIGALTTGNVLISWPPISTHLFRQASLWGCLCLVVLFIVGCGGDQGDTTAPADAAASPEDATPPPANANPADQVYKYSLSEVSALGDYGPPLDGGRVEIAPPENWRVGPRQSSMLVWYHEFKDAKLLPQIRISVEDAPEGAPQDATVENAKQYAKWVKDQLGDKKLVEDVVPLVLGDNTFGRYVALGKYKESPAHRLTLVTTREGRVYTIETIVFAGDLEKNRSNVLDGYAVGASLRKPSGDSVGGFPAPGEGS